MIIPALTMAASFGQFFSGFLQTLLAGGLFFVVLALLRSHLRFQFLTRQVKGEGVGELDLKTEDAFQIQVAQYLSTVSKTPEPFAVLCLALEDQERVEAELGPEAYLELRTYLIDSLTLVCRRGDTVTWKDDRTIGLILQLEREKLEGAVQRILAEALRVPFRSERGAFMKPTLVTGAATFPENGFSLRELVQAAQTELETLQEQKGHGLLVAAIVDTAASTPEDEPSDDDSVEKPAEDVVEDAEEEDSVEEAAPSLGVAPQTGRSLLDPMTGVLRADKVGPVMQRFVAKYRKDELPVSILYLDIDSLDRYNQHYGRKAGDQIIIEVSRIIQDITREEDIIGRVDGEEFIVSLACTPQEATLVAHRLVAEVKRTQVPFGNSSLRITACAGVAGFPDHGGVAKHLYDAAEAALGNAKMKGRNMVVMFHRGMRAQNMEVKKIDSF